MYGQDFKHSPEPKKLLFQEKSATYAAVCEARNLAPVSQASESLLHLAVSSSSAITISSSFTEADTGARDIGDLFPSPELVSYLCQAGFSPGEKNELGETPLHVAAKKVRGE